MWAYTCARTPTDHLISCIVSAIGQFLRTFPLFPCFHPFTYQSHLLGLAPHLHLGLVAYFFLAPSGSQSPSLSSCCLCSTSPVSLFLDVLSFRACNCSLSYSRREREKKTPHKYRETLKHIIESDSLISCFFSLKHKANLLGISNYKGDQRAEGWIARLFPFQPQMTPDDFTYDNKLRQSTTEQRQHLLYSD